MPLAGCSPADLLDHEAVEVARERAEGVRLAYVAATRARDVLVLPAIGDCEYDGWFGTLNAAIYPPPDIRRNPQAAPGCPEFGKDTVRTRPDGEPPRADTVRPGLYELHVGQGFSPANGEHVGQGFSPANGEHRAYRVIWWSPSALKLDADPPFGLRREDLIAKDAGDARRERRKNRLRHLVPRSRDRHREWIGTLAADPHCDRVRPRGRVARRRRRAPARGGHRAPARRRASDRPPLRHARACRARHRAARRRRHDAARAGDPGGPYPGRTRSRDVRGRGARRPRARAPAAGSCAPR